MVLEQHIVAGQLNLNLFEKKQDFITFYRNPLHYGMALALALGLWLWPWP